MHMKKFLLRTAALILLVSALFIINTPSAGAAYVTSAVGTVTTSGNLNVRSGAGLSSSVISTLPGGSNVTLLWKTGDWWCIEYAADCRGYVSASYIRYVYGTVAREATLSGGYLNVRSGRAQATASPARSQTAGWFSSCPSQMAGAKSSATDPSRAMSARAISAT